MATFFEESLVKLLKKDIINIVLSIQTEMQSNTKIVEEVNDNQQRVTDLERQCWANTQYSKRECLEVAGIPESVKQNELEDKVLRVLLRYSQ